MVFSDTTNDTGLYQDALFLLGVDSNAYGINDFTRSSNRWYYKAVIAVWEAQDTWIWDDGNQSGQPNASQDLVDAQQAYALPTGALKIRGVSVLDSASNWRKLIPISETQMRIDKAEFMENDGLPVYYELVEDEVNLYPAPATASVTTTNGLKIYFLREVDEFANSDTTQEPGLPEPFHRIISLGAAYDFAIAKEMGKASSLKLETEQLIREMQMFFSERHEGIRHRFHPRKFSYV